MGEAIETPEQAVRLQELGCERGQGYRYSRPVDRADATRLLGHGTLDHTDDASAA